MGVDRSPLEGAAMKDQLEYCVRTPLGYSVHIFANGSFMLCPNASLIDRICYNPGATALWLILEGWFQVFNPEFKRETAEL
jgi:hypothetical protein